MTQIIIHFCFNRPPWSLLDYDLFYDFSRSGPRAWSRTEHRSDKGGGWPTEGHPQIVCNSMKTSTRRTAHWRNEAKQANERNQSDRSKSTTRTICLTWPTPSTQE